MSANHGSRPALAIDIGGTKLGAALVDPDGSVLRRAEVPTPAASDGDPGRVAEALGAVVVEVLDNVVGPRGNAAGRNGSDGAAAPVAVGVASAGPLDVARRTVSPVNIPAWRDFPVLDAVADVLPGVPSALLGDAVAGALGEHWRGAGRESIAMLGIVVSTGIGGGLVLNGAAYPGPTGNAGHVGHIPADGDPTPCACGASGCVEALASGPAMVRWASERGWSGPDARALAADAKRGDPVALAAFDRGADALASGITSVAAICDLDLVVVNGGVAAAGSVLFDPLRKHVADRAHLDFVRRVRIVPGRLERDAGLVGAARFAFTTLEY